jgi:hypothetical protein
VGFVYGAPGTTFSLADTGDALALRMPAGTLQDLVDFRSFVTDPNTPLLASHFVGFMGNSTQLEPTVLTAADNDTATNWCVSFYGAGVRGSRIAHTAGVMNGSCKVAVLNEVLIDPVGGDDGKGFVEIAGPGGSVIGGAKIADVEGRGTLSRGQLNPVGEFTLPPETRIPADGILLVADTLANGNTTVPNFVDGVDVKTANLDLENSGGDSVQLISAGTPATLLDALGHDTNGGNLDTNTAVNGLAMYETNVTYYLAAGSVAVSLSRSPASGDTDNNRGDFRVDSTQTPGLPNDAANFAVTAITPDEAPNTVSSTLVTVTGTDFTPGMTARFGSGPLSTCNTMSPTQATCTAVGTATPSRVSVAFIQNSVIGGPLFTLASAYTYTAKYNETNDPMEADYCVLQDPPSFSVQAGQMTRLIYGRIYEAGLTEGGGAPAGVIAKVGYGPAGSDPTATNTWRYFDATYNRQEGNDDEFQASFVAPAAGNYSYVFRFSRDNGVRWTYCDLNGAGSNPGFNFEPATQLGVMTVTP